MVNREQTLCDSAQENIAEYISVLFYFGIGNVSVYDELKINL